MTSGGAGPWLEAAAHLQSEHDDDLRAQAREGLLVEAARTRLTDRVGDVLVVLRSGTVIRGGIDPHTRVAGHLAVLGPDDDRTLVPEWAVVSVAGSRPRLRDEGDAVDERLSAWLRRGWSDDRILRVLDAAGRWRTGAITWVAGDHVELCDDDGPVVIPYASAEAWRM